MQPLISLLLAAGLAALLAGLSPAARAQTPSGAAPSAPAGPPAPRDPATGRFANNHPHPPNASLLAWQWERLRDGLPPSPPPGGWPIPWVKTDAARLRAPDAAPSVTWIGHASVLVRLGGQNLLFDPVFSDRVSPVGFAGPKRAHPLPITLAELPHIDVVMVSHNHYDHLDADTVQRLAQQPGGPPRFLVPLGQKAWFATLGITRVDEFDWWQGTAAGGLDITFVPVQHWSRRGLTDTNQSLWGAWVVRQAAGPGGPYKLIHTGDTGYSADFKEVGQRLGPFDLAFIPIGAYAPRWFMKVMHVDVPEALQMRTDLRAERAIGMHWGTFLGLTDEPLDEPPLVLARLRSQQGLAPAQFDVMKIGETRALPGPAAP